MPPVSPKDVSPARGFRDHPPALKARREALLQAIREVYTAHGFSEIETPVVEPLERLRDSEGGENVGMIFEILRRGLTPADLERAADPHQLADLGLRYDLTVPLARFYATEHARLPSVARLIQIGPVWRAERPQRGRYRQFTQCDIDTIGERGMLAEVELIVATLRALERIGLQGSVVRLNDRRLLLAMLAACGVPADRQAAALIVIDKLDKIGPAGVGEQLAAMGLGPGVEALAGHLRRFVAGPVDIDAFVAALGGAEAVPPDAVEDHRTIVRDVRALAGEHAIRFDPSLVRGLGYYTGPIFEVEHPGSGHSVAGGGRYDGMIGRFLGREVPACGFSLGFDRLLELVPEETDAGGRRIALIHPPDAAPAEVLQEQARLIADSYRVTLVPRAKNMRRVFGEVRELGLEGYVELGRGEVRPLD